MKDLNTFLHLFNAAGIFVILYLISNTGQRPHRRRHRKPALTFIYLNPDYSKIKSNDMVVEFKPDQNATFQVAPTNRKGKPAKVQAGSVEYESVDPSIATVAEDPNDETKFTVKSSADDITESKTTDIKVKADADLGDGVVTIEGVLTVTVTPEAATGFGVSTISEPADNNP